MYVIPSLYVILNEVKNLILSAQNKKRLTSILAPVIYSKIILSYFTCIVITNQMKLLI